MYADLYTHAWLTRFRDMKIYAVIIVFSAYSVSLMGDFYNISN